MLTPDFTLKTCISPRSQSEEDPPGIAFFIEGGGTKGVYAVGVLKYLFEPNDYLLLKDVKIFGGTSVGSYIAAALSLGFTRDEMINVIQNIDMGNLIDSSYQILFTMYRLITQGYLYADTGREGVIRTILQTKIDSIKSDLGLDKDVKYGVDDVTFGDLRKLIKISPDTYRHLVINAVNLNRNVEIFFTTLEKRWDDIKLIDALMASSSIPYVFKPINLYYYPSTKSYGYHKTPESTLDSFYDGGVSTNNPLDYFLLHHSEYDDYHIWLLKFTDSAEYVPLKGVRERMYRLIDYLISGKNDIKMELIKEDYQINVINLHLKVGTLDIYSTKEVQAIINRIYQTCLIKGLDYE